MRLCLLLTAMIVVLLVGGCTESPSTTSGAPSGGGYYAEPVEPGEPVELSLVWYDDAYGEALPVTQGMVSVSIDLGSEDVLEQPFLDLHAVLTELPDTLLCKIDYSPKNVQYIYDANNEVVSMHVASPGGQGESPAVGVVQGVDASLIESIGSGEQQAPAFAPVNQ